MLKYILQRLLQGLLVMLALYTIVFFLVGWMPGDPFSSNEKNISKICETKYCVSLNSGTDALTLALKLLGIKKGDEVITPPNSFISSTSSIIHLGAKPVTLSPYEKSNISFHFGLAAY